MKKLRLYLLTPLLAVSLSGCAPLGALMSGPPQLPAQAQTISRTALDFALNSFDAALYGLDWAMDAHVLVPGSQQARDIAGTGRTVLRWLGAAEAARDLGSSATYEQAFANAKAALDQFRTLLPPRRPAVFQLVDRPPMSMAERERILRRLETSTTI